MPHQDKDDLRTPLSELKDLLQPIMNAELENVQRHGNAALDLGCVAMMALLTFGWNQQKTLGKRFEDARNAIKRGFSAATHAGSYQAMMVALRVTGRIVVAFLAEL